MKRSTIAVVVGTLVLLTACTSANDEQDADPTASTSLSSSPTVAIQTAIPDGIYRTRHEQFDKTIVYELRIKGDQFVLVAAEDGGSPSLADNGTFTVEGNTLVMTAVPPPCDYTMRYSLSDGVLALRLLSNECAVVIPQYAKDFMVRSAYEALPFKAVN